MPAALRRYIPVVILAAAVACLPFLLKALRLDYFLTQLTMTAYYTMAALGLGLLMGYAGQVSLGHAGFFAIGCYSAAVLSTLNLMPIAAAPAVTFLARAGIAAQAVDAYGAPTLLLNPWVGFCAAILITGGVSLLLGVPILRLRGHYLAMATLGFGFIVSRVLLGVRLFGEADGISDVPAFRLFAGLTITGRKAARVPNFYIAWALVTLAVLLLVNLLHSRAGRALRALHGNEEAASASGVNVPRFKLAAFLLSAVFAAAGGACLAHFNGGIGPGEASVMKSVRYLAIVAAGGMGSIWGTLSVSVLLTFLSLRGVFGYYDDLFFGAVLVAVMLFAPGGISSLLPRKASS